jgi:hypothetical protein
MFKQVLATAAFVALSGRPLAEAKPCPVPTMQSLSKAWVGSTHGEYYFLELSVDGTGVLTVQWASGKSAKAYRVSRTRITGTRVNFDLQPVDAPRESLYMRGDVCPGSIDLQIGSVAPKWRLNATLRPYEQELERLKAVTERAAQFRKSQ